MCVKCRINGELCCGRRETRGAWSASRCCMDLGAGEAVCTARPEVKVVEFTPSFVRFVTGEGVSAARPLFLLQGGQLI